MSFAARVVRSFHDGAEAVSLEGRLDTLRPEVEPAAHRRHVRQPATRAR